MSSNFLDAGCLWDATVAYSNVKGLGKPLHPSEESSSLSKQSSANWAPAEVDASMGSEAAPAGSRAQKLEQRCGEVLSVLHVCDIWRGGQASTSTFKTIMRHMQ